MGAWEDAKERAANSTGGASTAAGLGGATGYAAGYVTGGNVGKQWDKTFDTTKSHSQAKQGERNARAYYEEQQPIMQDMDRADQGYRDAFQAPANQLRSRMGALHDEAFQQSNDAKKTYTNTTQPRLKGIMEEAGREAQGAMTLAQAGDTNNSIHKNVRAMYDQQASNTRQQGMRDYGVLSALGAQSAQGAMGAPMTQGGQANIYAQNQSQAGEAVARAGQRVNDLKQQGIDRGFDESSRQYERGQGAKDRYRQSVGDISAAEADYHGRSAGLRGERQGYNAGMFDIENQRAGLDRDMVYAKGERQLGALGSRYGQMNQVLDNQMAANGQRQAGQMRVLGSMIGAGGQVAGAYAGKPPTPAPQQYGYG